MFRHTLCFIIFPRLSHVCALFRHHGPAPVDGWRLSNARNDDNITCSYVLLFWRLLCGRRSYIFIRRTDTIAACSRRCTQAASTTAPPSTSARQTSVRSGGAWLGRSSTSAWFRPWTLIMRCFYIENIRSILQRVNASWELKGTHFLPTAGESLGHPSCSFSCRGEQI